MFDQLVRPDPKPKEPKAAKGPRSFQDPRYPKVENPWGLSPAQCKILQLMCEGYQPMEVALRTALSVKTVSTHLLRVREKMDARSGLHAAILWDRAMRKVAL